MIKYVNNNGKELLRVEELDTIIMIPDAPESQLDRELEDLLDNIRFLETDLSPEGHFRQAIEGDWLCSWNGEWHTPDESEQKNLDTELEALKTCRTAFWTLIGTLEEAT